jgi:hypothetical protein
MAWVPFENSRQIKPTLDIAMFGTLKTSLRNPLPSFPTIHGIEFNRTQTPVLIIPFPQTLPITQRNRLTKDFPTATGDKNQQKLGRIIDTRPGGSMPEIKIIRKNKPKTKRLDDACGFCSRSLSPFSL